MTARDAQSEVHPLHVQLQALLAPFDRVRQLGGETPSHYYLRAIMLDKMKQRQPALENYQKFLALSNGKYADEEFKARQRARILEKELGK